MKSMSMKSFKDTNVYLSRNLVPPEIFDAVHDALKHNGAQVFLCCDPSKSASNDYHVISSPQHDKFDDLKAKGCNLIGPQCVISCAKENRELPKRQGFTCCLAMEGVKVLASGFKKHEEIMIEKLVTAMGGVIQKRASSDVNFVIVADVLAPKYKWALTILKKPIITISWLYQCWKEHRVAPQEPYRVLPFSGLTICVTRAKADVRKMMEKLIQQNGGKYSADLTKQCTHLISEAPEGDKYKVAKKWGNISIVNPKWLDQSVARRACLDEESYPVHGTSSASIIKHGAKGGVLGQQSQEKGNTNSQFDPSSFPTDSDTNLSQHMHSTFSDPTILMKGEESEAHALHPGDETKFDGFVADDSQTEDNDLYLSDCRILLVGFQSAGMRKLVSMVRKGGGSRYMSFTEKLTHIVMGTPSESEKKEVRQYAALGVIYVVKTIWLEDCDREKKEIPVSQRHIVSDLLPMKDPIYSSRAGTDITQAKNSRASTCVQADRVTMDIAFETGLSVEKNKGRKLSTNRQGGNSAEESAKSGRQGLFCSLKSDCKGQKKLHPPSDSQGAQDRGFSDVFKGLVFHFSSSFPEDRRAEILEWVEQGGGTIVDDPTKQNVQFIIERHGIKQRPGDVSHTTVVSSHWIKSSLEVGRMLDVGSHIIYSPLPCRIPFPGFDGFRFCVSQYEDKERLLLRNLCFVLGAKFTEILTKKVTHLICKFSSGHKYEAACKWKIQSVTSEWISECIKQDIIVPMDSFRPIDVTSHDREAGLCTTSQYPTQAAQMLYGDVPSQLPSQSQIAKKVKTQIICDNNSSKRAKLKVDGNNIDLVSARCHKDASSNKMDSMRNSTTSIVGEVSQAIPDVAAAIEDLLAQSNKIQDMAIPGKIGSNQSIFSPDRSILGQDNADSRSTFGISKHWLSRTEKQDDLCCTPTVQNVNRGVYDGFSETQTESQVVGYEEDLSGIQMIIDRVRTRSSLT